MDIQAYIDHIDVKIKRLAEKMINLRAENKLLREQNERLKADKAEHISQIGVLTNKLEEAQKALEKKTGEKPQEAEDLRKQLDLYINELDDVIEWLQTE